MGSVILPSGIRLSAPDLNCTVNLSEMINDAKRDDYTPAYRLAVIDHLGKLGSNSSAALPVLKEIFKSSPGILATAAEQAIKKIEDVLPVKIGLQHQQQHTFVKTLHPYETGYSQVYRKKPEIHKVLITPVETDLNVGEKTYLNCNFCSKLVCLTDKQRSWSNQLTKGEFYCSFCMRNNFHTSINKNILILTFRGLIGYYYYSFNVIPKTPTMYFTELQDYIDVHIKVGLQNPTFHYDYDSYCWFVDFQKIGKNKIPIEEILETIVGCLASFNMYETVKSCSPRKLYNIYKDAIMEFYEKKTCKEKILAPTLMNCDLPMIIPVGGRAISVDVLRGFLPSFLARKKY